MTLLLLLHFYFSGDSISLKKHIVPSDQIVMQAFSNDRVLLIEKQSSSIISVQFSNRQVDSYSFDEVINPITDFLIAYDKSIHLLTEFDPTIIRFDRLFNLIETIKLPEEITDASAFYLFKSGQYMILSHEQRRLYKYDINRQSISETIDSDSYSDLQFYSPEQIIIYNEKPAIKDRNQLHQFNTVFNYVKSIPIQDNIKDIFQSDSITIVLTNDYKLRLNNSLIADNVLSFSYLKSVLFYYTREQSVVKIEIN